MNPDEILLLGLNRSVTAISRADGSILWCTTLPESSANSFVSVVSDRRQVFATCHGVLYCLDLRTGDLLWTNPLKGYGYGIASLSLPGQRVESDAGAAARRAADAAAAATTAAAVG